MVVVVKHRILVGILVVVEIAPVATVKTKVLVVEMAVQEVVEVEPKATQLQVTITIQQIEEMTMVGEVDSVNMEMSAVGKETKLKSELSLGLGQSI